VLRSRLLLLHRQWLRGWQHRQLAYQQQQQHLLAAISSSSSLHLGSSSISISISRRSTTGSRSISPLSSSSSSSQLLGHPAVWLTLWLLRRRLRHGWQHSTQAAREAKLLQQEVLGPSGPVVGFAHAMRW
jgi:hypothetical protein